MNTDKLVKTARERVTDILFNTYRLVIVLILVTLCIPVVNPANICELINDNMSLFTAGIDYGSLTEGIIRAVNRGWVQESSFVILYISSMITCLSFAGAGACV